MSVRYVPRYDSFIAFLQTTIEAEGFRSLREGEEVEFVIEPSEDNRFKAVKVTGPEGAPPQVQQDVTHHKTVKPVQLLQMQTANEYMLAMYTNKNPANYTVVHSVSLCNHIFQHPSAAYTADYIHYSCSMHSHYASGDAPCMHLCGAAIEVVPSC